MKRLISMMIMLMFVAATTGCTMHRSDAGLLAGGVVGGVAGNAITGGSTTGTIVGAVGGAYVGHELAK